MRPGDAVAVRETQGHVLEYHLATVGAVRRGRIYLDKAAAWGGSSWYARSGKNCWSPKGQSRLVIPTEPVRDWIERRPLATWLNVDFDFTLK